jgi:hypothetical protein
MEECRCTIEFTHFTLLSRKGDNRIMIGLGNYFYGWESLPAWIRWMESGCVEELDCVGED